MSQLKFLPVKPVVPEPKNKLKDWIEYFVKLAGIALTSLAFLLSYNTYKNAQTWKEAEFTSLKFKEFSENKAHIAVVHMLDYSEREILFPDGTSYDVTDDLLYKALVIDTINSNFNSIHTKVRDTFDEYLEQLSNFNRYGKAELIKYDNMKPYLQYELAIFADSLNSRKEFYIKKRICDFIYYYHYQDVIELCNNLGFNMFASTQCQKTCTCGCK
jgi:hypothetical protein